MGEEHEQAKTLYQELTNDVATPIDALFWYVMGVISTAAVWIAVSLGG